MRQPSLVGRRPLPNRNTPAWIMRSLYSSIALNSSSVGRMPCSVSLSALRINMNFIPLTPLLAGGNSGSCGGQGNRQWRSSTCLLRRTVVLRLQMFELARQKAPLRFLDGQAQCALVGLPGSVDIAGAAQQVGPGGVIQVKVDYRPDIQPVQFLQPGGRRVPHGNR